VRTFRTALANCLLAETEFTHRRSNLLAQHGLDGDDVIANDTLPTAVADSLGPRDLELVHRIRQFESCPLGITLSGPAYRDNPLLYVNETFSEITGYQLMSVRGKNPRFLQGPETERAPLDRLHEAIDIWERVTVELRNYRRDGSQFDNRLTVVPVPDETGTINNWIGIQAAVDDV